MMKKSVTCGIVAAFLSVAASVAMAAAPTNGLLLHYTFDDIKGTKLMDASGRYNAEITGPSAQVEGISGKAMYFDGEETYVTLPANTFNKAREITISAWVKIDEKRMWSRVWDFGSGQQNFIMLTPFTGTHAVAFEFKPEDQSLQAIRSPKLGTDVWTNITATYQDRTLKLYLDGKEVAYNIYDPDASPSMDSFADMDQNYLGKSQYPDPMFKGSMDEFFIYDRVLSDAEIAALASK